MNLRVKGRRKQHKGEGGVMSPSCSPTRIFSPPAPQLWQCLWIKSTLCKSRPSFNPSSIPTLRRVPSLNVMVLIISQHGIRGRTENWRWSGLESSVHHLLGSHLSVLSFVYLFIHSPNTVEFFPGVFWRDTWPFLEVSFPLTSHLLLHCPLNVGGAHSQA